jgi:hypothetical protein
LSFSQNLKGIYVLNENTKTPISSVLISNLENSFQVNSDENGFVNLQNFSSENQKIYVSGIGSIIVSYLDSFLFVSDAKIGRIFPFQQKIQLIIFIG